MDEDPSRIDTPAPHHGPHRRGRSSPQHIPVTASADVVELGFDCDPVRGFARSECLPEEIVDQVMTDIFQAGSGLGSRSQAKPTS